MFSALGMQGHADRASAPTLLRFVDREIIEALDYHMRQHGRRLPARREASSRVEIDEREPVVAHLESGKRVLGDALLYTVGRQANTDLLNLEAAGLDRRRPREDRRSTSASRPSVPHIYAAGDVIGFPALASTSMEQGRLAALPHVRARVPQQRTDAASLRDLHDPGDLDGREDRGGAHEGEGPLRGRHLALRASSRRARCSGTRPAC